jgi:DNA-binding transcriptional regulator LsrR (DeoR family)
MENGKLEDLLLKKLVFDMYRAGITQDGIAKYLEKSKKTINDMLKPLPKKDIN